jgi:protein TonB
MLGSNLNIMTPQWLDVIFKDRNQAYGAYQLRRNNSRNTMRALIVAVSVFVFALSIPTIINIIKGFIPAPAEKIVVTQVDLAPPPMLEKKPEIKPPPVEKQVASKHDIVRFPPPVVRPDVETHEDPPTEKAIQSADLGQQNMKGNPNGADVVIDEKVGPKDVEGVIEGSDNKTIFTAVEINPEFPGGDGAFNKYLSTHIRYPNVAKENNVQGRVFIQFIVERDGSLTDLKAMRDPGSGLGDEAIRVLKTMPHWKPGIQNGKAVRVQYTVPVNFSLAE